MEFLEILGNHDTKSTLQLALFDYSQRGYAMGEDWITGIPESWAEIVVIFIVGLGLVSLFEISEKIKSKRRP